MPKRRARKAEAEEGLEYDELLKKFHTHPPDSLWHVKTCPACREKAIRWRVMK